MTRNEVPGAPMSLSAQRFKTFALSLIVVLAFLVVIPAGSSQAVPSSAWLLSEVDGIGDNGNQNSMALDSLSRPHISYYDSGNGRLLYSFYDGSDWNRMDVSSASDRLPSIALDDHDNVHIAFIDANVLKHAFYDGEDWEIVSVDTEGRGGISMALDPDGRPHISYLTSSNTRYAYWDNVSWNLLDVHIGEASFHTSIAVDSTGVPHILYRAFTPGLIYSYLDGGTFQKEVLGEASSTYYYHSLALDASNHPQMIYINSSGLLNHSHLDDDVWVNSTINSDRVANNIISIAFDGDDTMHVVCRNHSLGYLTYLKNPGGEWQSIVVDDDVTIDQDTAVFIAMDAANRPHISYQFNDHLWHAVYGNFWAPMFTDTPDDGQAGYPYEYRPSLSGDDSIIAYSTNAPFLSWDEDGYQGTPSFTQYGEYWINITALSTTGGLTSYQNETFHVDTRWVKENITRMHTSGGIGFGSIISMALDSSGNPHIAYSMGSENQLRYAHWDGASWVDVLVDGNGEAGGSPSLVLDEDDRPIIAYRNKTSSTNYEVKLAEWTGSVWQISTLLSDQNTGLSISAAIWGDRLSVSYSSNDGMRVDTRTGSDWSSSSLGEWGSHLSLQIDDSGGYHLAYNTYSEVRYAYRSDGSWAKTIVDSKDNYFGTAISMALDSSGRPHLSYHDSSDPYGMRYAFHDGTGWNTETVDSRGISGEYTSLSLDSQDRPHIMYYNPGAAHSNLNYAYHDGVSWRLEVVDGLDDNMGAHCSLALDASDVPHVAYYGDQGLRYATVEMRAPVFQDQPADGYQDTLYHYGPEFNEMSSIDSYETNAPFLVWNASSLAYEGTPSAAQTGTYWINISATSVYGGLSAYQNSSFSIRSLYAPTITPRNGESPQSGQVDYTYSYRIDANESVVWSLYSDAPFLTVEVNHSLSFKLSGTPTVAGSYYVNISATSIAGMLTAHENFTLTIMPKWAPEISSTPITTVVELSPYSYTVTVNETEIAWQALQTNAPFLSFSVDNQTVHGTPDAGMAGSYYVNVSVLSQNGKLIGHQNYSLTVGAAWAPTITSSPSNTTVQASTVWEYVPQANETVVWSYSTDAGAFLVYDSVQAQFTLSPERQHVGTYYLNITATSSGGGLASYQNLSIDVTGTWAPDWDITGPWNGEELSHYHLLIETNETVTWSFEHDLPASLQVVTDGTSLNISGWLLNGDAGDYYFNVSAVSVAGKDDRGGNHSISISPAWAPSFVSSPVTVGQVGQAYSYQLQLNESVTLGMDSDAPFLQMDDGLQLIFGTPSTGQEGTYYVNITASSVDGGRSTYQNYTLTIVGVWAPSFGDAPVDGWTGNEYNHSIHANETVTWDVAHDLPESLSVWYNGSTLLVFGEPGTGDGGVYYVNVTASSVDGKLQYNQNYTLRINTSWGPDLGPAPPHGQVTVFYNHTISANESLMGLVSYFNLPGSLDCDVDSLNGSIRIYGTPQAGDEGVYGVNFTAYSLDGMGWSYFEWNFTIMPTWAPDFVSGPPTAPAGQFVPGQAFHYQVLTNESCVFSMDSDASFLSIDANGSISGVLQAGTWYVNVSATSVDGLEAGYYNFSISTVDKVLFQGVVRDAEGNPLAGVSLRLGGTVIATTDANGSYSVLLDEGIYEVGLEKDGYVVSTLDLQAQVGTTLTQETVLDAEGGETLDPMLIGAAALVAVLAVMAAVFYMRRP